MCKGKCSRELCGAGKVCHLGYQSPLYGRRTAQFKIQPFSFFESIRFHPHYDAYDNAVIYGITGGIPHIWRV